MPAIADRQRFKQRLRNHLIGAGYKGYRHSDLIQKTRTRAFPAKTVRDVLEDWHSRGLIQRFEVREPTSKKPVTYWRATTAITNGRL